MAKLYLRAVLAGTKNFSEVTALYKPQVRKLLEELVTKGELSFDRFTIIINN